MNWYLKVMREYVNFNGRARRTEYWMFFLVYIGVMVVASIIDAVLSISFVTAIASLVHLLPSIGVGARRLHDINRSGWWMLVALIPIIGWIIAIYWAVKEGDVGDNAYGPDPKAVALPA